MKPAASPAHYPNAAGRELPLYFWLGWLLAIQLAPLSHYVALILLQET
jgi:hypothetical protein